MRRIIDLHDDALIAIFQFFKLKELPTLLQVCKHWRDVIDSCNDVWRKFIPKCKGFTPPNAKTSKHALRKIRRKCFLIGEEMWYPDPDPQLVARNKMIRYCDQWGFGIKKPKRTGFKLYFRLNPVYDFVTDHENENLSALINKIWEDFYAGQPFADTSDEDNAYDWEYRLEYRLELSTVNEVIEKSKIQKFDASFKKVEYFLLLF